jgi:hypothetical protein
MELISVSSSGQVIRTGQVEDQLKNEIDQHQ